MGDDKIYKIYGEGSAPSAATPDPPAQPQPGVPTMNLLEGATMPDETRPKSTTKEQFAADALLFGLIGFVLAVAYVVMLDVPVVDKVGIGAALFLSLGGLAWLASAESKS